MDIPEELQTDLLPPVLSRLRKKMKPYARTSLQSSVLQEILPQDEVFTKQFCISWVTDIRDDGRHQSLRNHQEERSPDGQNNTQSTALRKRRSPGQRSTSNVFLKKNLATTSRQHHQQLHQEEIKTDLFGTRTRTWKDPEGKGRRRIGF